MDRIYKQEKIRYYKDNANKAKDHLISLQYALEDIGAIREANSLGTIIQKLETWQNK